ncbi:MAG: 50S ribosomal protein L23 [bacterium]|nr:50S ribosomal protein L23 [bacterium]
MALLDILKKKKMNPIRSLARAKGASPENLGEATSNGVKQEKTAKAVSEEGVPAKKQKPVQKQKAESAPKSEKEKKGERFSHILVRPRISEKAALQSGGNSYIFDVAVGANKIEIKKAIQEIYNVSPIRVNVINMKSKRKMVRNRLGKTASYKKAIVFLRDGDNIELT